MKAKVRHAFDPDAEYLCRRTLTIEGRTYLPGEDFPKHLVAEKRVKRLFEQRSIIRNGAITPGRQLTEEEAAEAAVAQRRAAASAKAVSFTESSSIGAAKARAAATGEAEAPKKAEKKAKGGKGGKKGNNPPKKGAEPPAKPAGADQQEPPPPPNAGDQTTPPTVDGKPADDQTNEGGEGTEGNDGNADSDQGGECGTDQDGAGDDGANGENQNQSSDRETFTDPEAIAKARAAVEIPDDWASLTWPKRLSLAASLTDEKVKNGEDAAKAINAELARRGNP